MLMDELWESLREVASHGEQAWQPLLVRLEPLLTRLAERHTPPPLQHSDDAPRDIVLRTIARLHAKDFAAVKKLVALDPPPELQAWLRVLVKRAAIDHMRELPEYERATAKRDHRWVSLATLSSSVSPAAAPDTLADKRDRVTAFVVEAADRAAAEERAHGEEDAIARLATEWRVTRLHVRRLLARRDQYVAVLRAVLAGFSYPEVATQLGLSRREVELTVRYLEELLAARGFAG